jgi:hypothetical protein
MLHKLGVVSALGIGVLIGWTACVGTAYAASKCIERDISKWLKEPIRATED